jgi:hypothetical protein
MVESEAPLVVYDLVYYYNTRVQSILEIRGDLSISIPLRQTRRRSCLFKYIQYIGILRNGMRVIGDQAPRYYHIRIIMLCRYYIIVS